MTYSKTVAKALLDIRAVTLRPDKPFTWASGLKAPIYTDNRLTISYPTVRQAIFDGMVGQIKSHFGDVEVIAGTATAGIPHAAWVAQRMGLPLIYVRAKPKDHGQGRQIEGVLQKGQRVVVIDDLISTGGSVLNAVRAVKAAGGEVLGVVAVFSYGLSSATDNFMASGLRYYSVTDYPTLIQVARESHKIDADHLISLQRWRKDPQQWSKERE